ncbi:MULTISPECIES: alkene reductase [Rhizobium]|uniref:N-ethylmaleimide reductase n=1 Tax=Rhizobium miluonense TaxID=411945 RepID=A0A1C3VYI2_9HYPH|nr:alkene reductase [Rhizobium miluonense]SCB32746.1 N-ethylmaleimide reductase [Rhizobium miluonense]
MSKIFTSTRLGRIEIANRLVMAPMTRSRADDDDAVPGDLVATYYAQRASAGLIVTEGVFPTSGGKGYVRTPGIQTEPQLKAWKAVVDAVHAAGGRIFLQLMHTGRISHPLLLPGGELPVAPSAIRPNGQTWTNEGQKDFVTPHELSLAEIKETVRNYRVATRHALAVGFDGVELHGASGYLPEQFLSSGSNQRTDEYGGSVANRARFMLEVLAAMIDEAGVGRVGLKISPEMNFNDISDANPQETYSYLVEHLQASDMAYLHVALFGAAVNYRELLRPRFAGSYIIGGGLTRASAEELLQEGKADAVVFGSAFLANPDLVERFRRNAPLNEPDRSTFYAPGAEGYIDYPTLAG